jgi:release factor glutamine methyltransferase
VRDEFRAVDFETPELDARLLAEAAFGLDKLNLSLEERKGAAPEGAARLRALAARRLAGEPVARLLGHKEFYGLDFELSAATLVPRPETELVVDLGLRAVKDMAAPVLLDLGTGSGCIAIALLVHLPGARAIATELSGEALEMARRNAGRLGVGDRLDLRQGSWCAPLAPNESFDLVVANPPYVAEGDPHLAAGDLRFEPRAALLGGVDGLAAIREIVRGAPAHLAAGGRLLLEHGIGQGGAVRTLLAEAGLEGVTSWPDLAGIARVSGGRLES